MTTPYPHAEPVDALLICPPWLSKDRSIWHGIKGAMPPLGLLSIAAYAEREGYRVRMFDVHVERWGIAQFRDALETVTPRFVGISLLTSTAIAGNRVARIVKEVHPDCTVVVGGVHADVMTAECLKNDAIDIVVHGDGERTFARLLSGELPGSVEGVSFRSGRGVVHNPPAPVITDLDDMPMPAYHLVPMAKYYPTIGAYRRLPAINMLMTRGCPGKCTFCNSAETVLRTRSADKVVDEIAHLRKAYGIREIQFYDDTFTIYKQNVLRFCHLMAQRRLGVSWTAFVRTDCFSEKIARAMKKAGCHQVMFGVESGDDRILEIIRKPIDRAQTLHAVRLAQRVGLEVRATFMLGNQGETPTSMQRTIDYAVALDPDLAIFNIATPYPGTQMFTWAKRHGYLTTEDWGDYGLCDAIVRLPSVTPEQIQEAYRRAHSAFYRRPQLIFRRLKRIRHVRHLVDNVHAFFYIVLRLDVSKREISRKEWIDAKKEDFWTVPIGGEVTRDSLGPVDVIAQGTLRKDSVLPGSASRNVPLPVLRNP